MRLKLLLIKSLHQCHNLRIVQQVVNPNLVVHFEQLQSNNCTVMTFPMEKTCVSFFNLYQMRITLCNAV
jgi:hypothetical protein